MTTGWILDSMITSGARRIHCTANMREYDETDIREKDDSYELDVNLPGFKKDEIKIQLKDGYLTLSTVKGLDKDEQDKKETTSVENVMQVQ